MNIVKKLTILTLVAAFMSFSVNAKVTIKKDILSKKYDSLIAALKTNPKLNSFIQASNQKKEVDDMWGNMFLIALRQFGGTTLSAIESRSPITEANITQIDKHLKSILTSVGRVLSGMPPANILMQIVDFTVYLQQGEKEKNWIEKVMENPKAKI